MSLGTEQIFVVGAFIEVQLPLHPTRLTCAGAWASMHCILSLKSLLHCSNWHLSPIYLVQDDGFVLIMVSG